MRPKAQGHVRNAAIGLGVVVLMVLVAFAASTYTWQTHRTVLVSFAERWIDTEGNVTFTAYCKDGKHYVIGEPEYVQIRRYGGGILIVRETHSVLAAAKQEVNLVPERDRQ